MTYDTLYDLSPLLIALQFLAVSWRVNRVIQTAERQGVIPLPDVINIMSLVRHRRLRDHLAHRDRVVFLALANGRERRLGLDRFPSTGNRGALSTLG